MGRIEVKRVERIGSVYTTSLGEARSCHPLRMAVVHPIEPEMMYVDQALDWLWQGGIDLALNILNLLNKLVGM